MSSAYKRVSSDDPSNQAASNGIYARRNNVSSSSPPSVETSTKTRSERISDKIHAAIWVGTAVIVGQYTNFIPTLFTDPLIVRPLFNIAIVCIMINSILTFYLAVYLPRFQNIHSTSAWEVYCPRVIPTMTVLGLICIFCLIRCTWPVWGFLSPLVLGIEAMGCLFSLHFIPSF